MSELHSHQFRPVTQIWLGGREEEQELCCKCGEKLWITFEESPLSRDGLIDRVRRGFDRFVRLGALYL